MEAIVGVFVFDGECAVARNFLDHMERPTSALHLTRVTLTV